MTLHDEIQNGDHGFIFMAYVEFTKCWAQSVKHGWQTLHLVMAGNDNGKLGCAHDGHSTARGRLGEWESTCPENFRVHSGMMVLVAG